MAVWRGFLAIGLLGAHRKQPAFPLECKRTLCVVLQDMSSCSALRVAKSCSVILCSSELQIFRELRGGQESLKRASTTTRAEHQVTFADRQSAGPGSPL